MMKIAILGATVDHRMKRTMILSCFERPVYLDPGRKTRLKRIFIRDIKSLYFGLKYRRILGSIFPVIEEWAG